jgi:hypothetical protein
VKSISLLPNPSGQGHPAAGYVPLMIVVLAVFIAAIPGLSRGATVCIPQVGSVPALPGPPNWWDASVGQPQHWPRVDDPRWRGAFLHSPIAGSAATHHVTFRALRSGSSLYFQWHVTVDPLLDQNEHLYVTFSPGAGKPDLFIDLVPFNSANDDIPANQNAVPAPSLPAPATVAVATRMSGATFAAAASLPQWIDPATTHTRVIRSLADHSWAVMMEIPVATNVDDGIDLGTSFSMWFDVEVSHTTGSASYRYPAGLDLDAILAGTDNTGWQAADRSLSPSDPSCIQGISLDVSDVGVAPPSNPSGPLVSEIELKTSTGGPGLNTLCARPLNQSGNPINSPDLEVNFRTANWGSQPDWNDVTDPVHSLWKLVNPTPVIGPPGTIANGAKGNLTFAWQLTTNDGTVNDVCTFTPQPTGLGCGPLPPKPRQRHQCMLVELNGAPGLTFTTSSVYRNMQFVGASTFRRDAEISVVGLAPQATPQPRRDVYLYVQTTNMPARVGGPRPAPSGFGGKTVDIHGRPPSGGQPIQIQPLEKTEYAALRDSVPTYQVHAFHETGRTVTVNGRTIRELEPQTSFGYFVDHQGRLEGWRHQLIGAQQIAPNYYRIAVPENGTATVTTVIEAIEMGRWSLSLHGGISLPQSDLDTSCDGGLSLGADVEYRFHPVYSIELFYGRETFDCAPDDVDLDHVSLNGKAIFGPPTWRPFVGAGVGWYGFSPGSSETGFNVSAGLQANLWPRLALEATAREHLVESDGATANFATAQLGVRIRF